GWMWLYPKFFPAKPTAPAPKPVVAAPADKPAEVGKTEPPKPAVEPAHYEAKPILTLSSKYLEATFTNKGAGVQSLVLHHPKATDEVRILEPYDPVIPHLAVREVGGA